MAKAKSFFLILTPTLILPILGALVGIGTQSGVDGWYETITRSTLTPPNWVFGTVWSILYIMMGLSLGLIFTTTGLHHRKKLILKLFILQLVLNLAWSFVFFQLHLLWSSAIWVGLLAGLVLFLIRTLLPFRRLAAALLIPYVLWLCFAFYLSLTIALLN